MSIIREYGFDVSKIVSNGNKFLIGNGYLGYRGTLDEFTAKDCVGLNVAGLYDGVVGKWRETVNAFNPFYLEASANGAPLTVFSQNMREHCVELDLSCGLFRRKTLFDVDGANVELVCERFVSAADKNVLCSRVYIRSDKELALTIKAAVDVDVWDINGPHLRNVTVCSEASVVTASAQTQELHIPVKVTCNYSHSIGSFDGKYAYTDFRLKANETFVYDRVAFVSVNGDYACNVTYDEAFKAHVSEWRRLWDVAAFNIQGDERANLALEYSIYHLLILAPKGDYSIAARGLSAQTYKGAVFWDTEIFMLPFFLENFPHCAENLIKYRIRTLPEAREKAEHYGYKGAFYAWESQDGVDACSDFNVTDVFTHRPVRTYFKDKQIHISADVAYAVLNYYFKTNDDELMLNGGLQTVFECAEFARTYSYYNHNKDRYELLDVIGPDEYHERVNNNAYTNYMFYKTTVDGLTVAKKLQSAYPERFDEIAGKFADGFITRLEQWARKLYLPQPNADGVIEQFDGYFNLENVRVDEVRERLVHPQEYWGGSNGVATATRVIKQADVIMLLNLYPNLFPLEVQRANYDFYLPYTEHGSSLSHCAYAICACRIGKSADAYEAFLDSAEIDLKGGGKQWAGEIYIGGTHPAASGGAWIAAKSIFNAKGERK